MANEVTLISDLTTPLCLIDRRKMQQNITRLAQHVGQLGCQIRPHVKTHKSIGVTQEIMSGGHVCGITVSTLKEAQYFFEQGIDDILYAVGIVPNKLATVARLIQAGCNIKIVLDSLAMAKLIVDKAAQFDCSFKIMIELDTDGHRSGMDPYSDALISVAQTLDDCSNIELLGVMTHAGESYNCFTPESQISMARQERDLSLVAANRLRESGFACPEVSIGSTPTAFAIDDLTGITEVRAGVYVFFDLVMSGLGVCKDDDIAISVLTSVIGYQEDKNWVITDAGWMAMSRDRGTAEHPLDQGYGLVKGVSKQISGDCIVSDANQEHGIVSCRDASQSINYSDFPIASQLKILPNHACSTAAQFDHFVVVEEDNVVAQWSSISGW